MSRRHLVLIAGSDPLIALSGHDSYVRAHARGARRAGFEPHLFCVSDRSEVVRTSFGTVHRVSSPFRPFRQLMVPLHGPLLVNAVRRFLGSASGPHVIHGFGAWGYVGVRASRGIDAVPITSSYTVMAHESRARIPGAYRNGQLGRVLGEHLWITLVVRYHERLAHQGARLVLVNYESVRRLLLARYQTLTNLSMAPYTSESTLLPRTATEPGPPEVLAQLEPAGAPVVVAVARHDPRKGLDILLHALADLSARGVAVRACLVGGGLLLSQHRRLATTLGLERSVALLGFVPDPAPFLRHGDLFVLPSLAEGSGSVALIEALEAGLPAVVSGIDGLAEDVVDGESALLVEPGRAPALAEAIRRVVTEAPLRLTLARGARHAFERRFAPEPFVAWLKALYATHGL